jgi:polysaccharide deacetylase family protein (PEP-CTERM system associated)
MTAQSVLSVDVEDYFHVENFAHMIRRDQWESFPSRIQDNTRRLLDLFDTCEVKATCFILGWVAERYPGLVREIVDRGHEPACHSFWHRLVFNLAPQEFRDDTMRAKNCIEQAAGVAVAGYRAPSFSITRKSLWAVEILVELGFTYDSSIFPVRHDCYGIPDAPRQPHPIQTPAGVLMEFPMTTFRFPGGPNLPVAGGGYLRLLPYWYTEMGIRHARKENRPVMIYVHPWEVDAQQPRMNVSFLKRVRHYANLSKTHSRLEQLIRSARCTTFRESGFLPLASRDLAVAVHGSV